MKVLYLFNYKIILNIFLSFLPSSYDHGDLKQYFMEVALGDEFGSRRQYLKKWTQPINFFVMGEPDQMLLDELDLISKEIYQITALPVCRVYSKEDANCIVYFGPASEYVRQIDPTASPYISTNRGLFSFRTNAQKEIIWASLYVDIQRVSNPYAQRHLLREELTQLLGLPNDSFRYKESIFFQKWSFITTYSKIDIAILRTLYHPSLRAGMSPKKVKQVLDRLYP